MVSRHMERPVKVKFLRVSVRQSRACHTQTRQPASAGPTCFVGIRLDSRPLLYSTPDSTELYLDTGSDGKLTSILLLTVRV
ncbi:hypothetical protein BaRGS_00038017 [Batillaria attramentaria]|uniref:Uncharacterized protein n=1 Tax=Batillaria attramentaria TaxID=370345 RepID=A0ABD0J7B3_9CAEN